VKISPTFFLTSNFWIKIAEGIKERDSMLKNKAKIQLFTTFPVSYIFGQ